MQVWATHLIIVSIACIAKRFLESLSRKLGREQKKNNDGGGERRNISSSPLPLPLLSFFCSCSNFCALARLETLVMQANVSKIFQLSEAMSLVILNVWLLNFKILFEMSIDNYLQTRPHQILKKKNRTCHSLYKDFTWLLAKDQCSGLLPQQTPVRCIACGLVRYGYGSGDKLTGYTSFHPSLQNGRFQSTAQVFHFNLFIYY